LSQTTRQYFKKIKGKIEIRKAKSYSRDESSPSVTAHLGFPEGLLAASNMVFRPFLSRPPSVNRDFTLLKYISGFAVCPIKKCEIILEIR
jgi:hypothetical protein